MAKNNTAVESCKICIDSVSCHRGCCRCRTGEGGHRRQGHLQRCPPSSSVQRAPRTSGGEEAGEGGEAEEVGYREVSEKSQLVIYIY